jgi:hypothetical protein
VRARPLSRSSVAADWAGFRQALSAVLYLAVDMAADLGCCLRVLVLYRSARRLCVVAIDLYEPPVAVEPEPIGVGSPLTEVLTTNDALHRCDGPIAERLAAFLRRDVHMCVPCSVCIKCVCVLMPVWETDPFRQIGRHFCCRWHGAWCC